MLQVLVRRLDFGDLINVFETDGAHDVMSGTASALLYARGFLEEVGSWRSLCDEGERAVRLDGNQCGNGDARFNVRSASIEFLAEVHRLDTTGTQSRTDRRSGCCLASRYKQALPEHKSEDHTQHWIEEYDAQLSAPSH